MRLSYFDNAKFFLMILVVVGHLLEPYNEGLNMRPIYHFLYAFHMPLFVFISGYFSKKLDGPNYHIKVISSLVVPYIIFETLYSAFDYLLFNKEKLEFSYFNPYWIMWFLFSMIFWKLILPYVVKIKFALPLFILVAVFAGYADDIQYYASISRTIYFFPFFLLGFYFKKEWIEKITQSKTRILSIAFLILSFTVFSNTVGGTLHTRWFYGAGSYSSFGFDEWYAGVYRLLSYTFTMILGACILSLIPSMKIKYITVWGQNTMYVFVLHGFILKYLLHMEYYYAFNSSKGKLALVFVGILLTALLSSGILKRCFKWIVEPNVNFLFTRDQRIENKDTFSA